MTLVTAEIFIWDSIAQKIFYHSYLYCLLGDFEPPHPAVISQELVQQTITGIMRWFKTFFLKHFRRNFLSFLVLYDDSAVVKEKEHI